MVPTASRRLAFRLLARPLPHRLPISLATCPRCHSTETAPSPVLSKLREDLKTAMRARDQVRLAVLRGVLADITNLSKTASPVQDDLNLLALLKKRIASGKNSVQEFYEADRKDLVFKEQEQLAILEEYASGVKTMGETEIRDAVKATVESLRTEGKKLALGDVMKRAIGPGGVLEGKPVEKPLVARIIKEELGA
ncbi:GatB/YqeY domain-containing protein [Trichodelitschia bisporula]|uniref:Altered inheritance of mitochondria protein 41 n=1 Tax=Trichodelitschia bisporula TaxID=703511 RepID=A0A6G1I5N0_9PEZI|nr:GatB/YqeY domain-containing protein [Trichodelitschia bisporula]